MPQQSRKSKISIVESLKFKRLIIPNAVEDVEELALSYLADADVQWYIWEKV